MRICTFFLLIVAFGCSGGDATTDPSNGDLLGADGGSDGTNGAADSNADSGDCSALEAMCDNQTMRAVGCGAYSCSTQPEFMTLTGIESDGSHRFKIFTHEASHPLATPTQSHPCSSIENPDPNRSARLNYQAPNVPTEACSREGVIPWHNVVYADAEAACQKIGWRLCSPEELLRACQGPSRRAYPYGSSFESGRCNLNSTLGDVAATGRYSECESDEGGFDLNGNLWEWTSRSDPQDPRARYYQGGGWKIVAERHQPSELRCETDTRLPGLSAPTYQANTVGFRCCQDVD